MLNGNKRVNMVHVDDIIAATRQCLITPRPEHRFRGLKPGDRWCVCAARWLEAERAGCAPPVSLLGTDAGALEVIPLEILKRYATA